MRKLKKTLCLMIVFALVFTFNASLIAETGSRVLPDSVVIYEFDTGFNTQVQAEQDYVMTHYFDWCDEMLAILAEQNQVTGYYFGWCDEMLAIIAEQERVREYHFDWCDEMLAIIAEQERVREYHFDWCDEMLAIIAEQERVREYHFDWCDEMLAILAEQDYVTTHYFDWCDEMLAIIAEQNQVTEYYSGWCEYFLYTQQHQPDAVIDYDFSHEYYHPHNYGDDSITPNNAPILNLSTSSWNPLSGASFNTVSVTSNRQWTVTSSSTSWLTISNVSPINRTGNGSFRINATANTEATQRTGFITVSTPGLPNRTIVVSQAAAPATLNLSTASWNPTSAAQNSVVQVTSNRQWTVTSSNTSWLTISNITPANRTGNGSFRINATANTGAASRTGTITVTAPGATTRTISVTQAAAPATLTISPTSMSFTSVASNGNVNVSSNRTWTISSNVTWLTFSNINPANRTGNGSFSINATANTGAASRTGTVTVTAPGATTRTITVTQAAAPATLTTSPTSMSFTSVASNGNVNVSSNRTWAVASSNTSWLTISNISPWSSTGNGSFRINATANTGATPRTGTITVTAPGATTRTISVTQAAAPATLTLTMASWTPLAGASFADVQVNSNRTWDISSNAAWLTVSNITPANRTGNGSFRINATANTGAVSRSGTITVTTPGAATRTISVTQAAAPATLNLSAASWNPTSAAQNAVVLVSSTRQWSVTSNATSWLTISNISPANQTGDGSFRINVTANTSVAARSGTIAVTAPGVSTRTIIVTQAGANATLTLNPSATWNASPLATNRTINVTSNTTWGISSDTSWLTISNISPANRTGNGSFRINATANTGTTPRSGTITVTAPGAATRTISVTQAAAPAALTLDPSTEWHLSERAESRTINVTSNTTWNVSSNASWLTISNISPANRTGNGSFRINTTANTGVWRQGTITVTGGGLTRQIRVTQPARSINLNARILHDSTALGLHTQTQMRTITSNAVDVFRGTFNVHFNINSVAQISGLNASLSTGCAHTILCTDVRCGANCNDDHCKAGRRKINVNGHSTIYTIRIVGYLICAVDATHHNPPLHRAVGGLGQLPGRNTIASNRYATNSNRNTDALLHWIIQHELGHNLGAFDDIAGNHCTTDQDCTMRNITGANRFCRNCYNTIRAHLTARYVSFNYECEY